MCTSSTIDHITNLACQGTVVAVNTDLNSISDYELLLVTSEGLMVLPESSSDDYNHQYPAGTVVLRGHYFDKIAESRRNYKYKLLDVKIALIPKRAVIYVCVEHQETTFRHQKVYMLDYKDHEDILMCIID